MTSPTPPDAKADKNGAHKYAERLLIALMEKHYPDRSPDWAPLPDLLGVLMQIDNLTTGLERIAPGWRSDMENAPSEPVSGGE